MSATIAAPVSAKPSWTNALRLGLVALAVVVLLVASFAIGRATEGTSSSSRPVTPTTAVHAAGTPASPAGATATTT